MEFITPDVVETMDGSRTLRNGIDGSLYHSDRGARGEAEYVYIERAFCHYLQTSGNRRVTVFEMGFGSGLNCLLTLDKARELGVEVDYRAVELFPIDLSVAAQYAEGEEFVCLHAAPWGERVQVVEGFTLTKHYGDLRDFQWGELRGVGVCYFDAFSPDEQPELWSEAVFAQLRDAMAEGGVVTTYSSKGVVKRALRSAGFEVERLEGALGKRHMLRATKR